MHRNPFLDKIIDDVITPTHSFSFDGYHTPKTAEDAKPIIEEYKEGLRKYKEFYEDLEEADYLHEPIKRVYQKYASFCISNNLQAMSAIEFQKQMKKQYNSHIEYLIMNLQ